MTTSVTCPWCHAFVTLTGLRTECPSCGHRADICRLDCDCPTCRRVGASLGTWPPRPEDPDDQDG